MKRISFWLVTALLSNVAAVAQTPSLVRNPSGTLAAPQATMEETGLTAVYSDTLSGHVTASGKIYDPKKLTAAHKTLPFGTRIRVTNTKNGKSVELRITDRGPKQADRILDITPRAARALGIRKLGMGEVKLEVIEMNSPR